MAKEQLQLQANQCPIAIVGLACRLPGGCNSTQQFWTFLERGGIAGTEPPQSRFNLGGHYDGSSRPGTMRSPGGMFIDNDPQDIDGQFFGLSQAEATAMDPQQRQLLEVVYEGLENAGITLDGLYGKHYGCFVGSYANDYGDAQARDPEERPPLVTIGIGRAMLSNRISHFLNLKGPSMTLDTACSGSLVGVDLACKYLHLRDIDGAIVAGCNLYLSPEHNTDTMAMQGASTKTGRCHTFDAKADGYMKAEAVNVVVLKRLEDAIGDMDPIRGVILGTATNSDGWTPGIASPNAESQCSAIQKAYTNAGITNKRETGYLECHGTGTQAGDPVEARGAGAAFGPLEYGQSPLIIGSVKSNIGHSEPASGLSGLLKAVLALEQKQIPGNPTFLSPNPNIDFEALGLQVATKLTSWPASKRLRASVNSFGYGGTNAHAVIESIESVLPAYSNQLKLSKSPSQNDLFEDLRETDATQPNILVFSANDEKALRANIDSLRKHLVHPSTDVALRDLAYTLLKRRSHLFHRAFAIVDRPRIPKSDIFFGKKGTQVPCIGFVFTGQGSQWPQMGKDLLTHFPAARRMLLQLDKALESLSNPPKWSLLDELVDAREAIALRKPEFSQPLITALQLAQIEVLREWGIEAECVIGHSSGEIAAASAAGYLTREEAIQIAYLRGVSISSHVGEYTTGMLAVGLGAEDVTQFLVNYKSEVQISCFNSPRSLTLSGKLKHLEELKSHLESQGHFARLLQVDVAYHSSYISGVGRTYDQLLSDNGLGLTSSAPRLAFFSTVTGSRLDTSCNNSYWVSNMLQPVKFEQGLRAMISSGANLLIEIGPSNALSGPIAQILDTFTQSPSQVAYHALAQRGKDCCGTLLNVIGHLYLVGQPLLFDSSHSDNEAEHPKVVIDLPNYRWNHSVKYWSESQSSRDWRFREFITHDLLGSKLLGTPWESPVFKKMLKLNELHWLRDHKIGNEYIFPASGYIAMAIESMRQAEYVDQRIANVDNHSPIFGEYTLRDVVFERALILRDDGSAHHLILTLCPPGSSATSWRNFKISSSNDGSLIDHCSGSIKFIKRVSSSEIACLEPATLQISNSAQLWYKAMSDVGYNFGPAFRRQIDIKAVEGWRVSRSILDVRPPQSSVQQSNYPIHPACLDACLQSSAPALWSGRRSAVDSVLVPAYLRTLVLNQAILTGNEGYAHCKSEYSKVGRSDKVTNQRSDICVSSSLQSHPFLKISGLQLQSLEVSHRNNAPEAYSHEIWMPDLSFSMPLQCNAGGRRFASIQQNEAKGNRRDTLDNGGTIELGRKECTSMNLSELVTCMKHKQCPLRVAEVSLLESNSSVFWLDGGLGTNDIHHHCHLTYYSNDAEGLSKLQSHHNNVETIEFIYKDHAKADHEQNRTLEGFHLMILKLCGDPNTSSRDAIRNCHRMMTDSGILILLVSPFPDVKCDSHHQNDGLLANEMGPISRKIREATPHVNGTPACFEDRVQNFERQVELAGYSNLRPIEIDRDDYLSPQCAGFAVVKPSSTSNRPLRIVSFDEQSSELKNLISGLKSIGWNCSEHANDTEGCDSEDLFVIFNESASLLMPKVSSGQWKSIQKLFLNKRNVLWINGGESHDHNRAQRAIFLGFARSARAENATLNLKTLELETKLSSSDLDLVHEIIVRFDSLDDYEYIEQSGVLTIGRIVLNHKFGQQCSQDNALYESELHSSEKSVHLECGQLGAIGSLQYAEFSEAAELPVGFVEIEIYAAGLNFKDVAVTMGIVPENEHLLGLEGAGVIRRVGRGAEPFSVGQRIVTYRKGTFGNRICAPIERVHLLPDSMSFEEASTLACVYGVSMHGLLDWAHMRRNDKVLVHSAAGGVGIAAMNLCKYVGAEIFATVGTDEKRTFLREDFGIPDDHIYSSRDTGFGERLMEVTAGHGCDIILNSLTGDMLHESWRCIAEGGTMIEIGKKDLLSRNNLPMEPFLRNASFRALDMSHHSISDETIAGLLRNIFKLLDAGHIKPIGPIKTFSFAQIPAAMRYMRAGNHLGKIVISDTETADPKVTVRPLQRLLQFDQRTCYLLVGGLKGICGSLAVYLARRGVRYLVVLSRSGASDLKSQSILASLKVHSCGATIIRGDVACIEDVRRAFALAPVPIDGVIHGAMVLRDKVLASMSVEEYREVIEPKVQGTMNLHEVSLQQSYPLKTFTLLSSLSGVIGQRGQANYAAANVFLDYFAKYRLSCGLPACSIDLGIIEDVGYISEHENLAARLDRTTWATGINETQLHRIITRALEMQIRQASDPDEGSQLIAGIPIPQPWNSELMRDPRFRGLCFGNSASIETTDPEKGFIGDPLAQELQAITLIIKSQGAPKDRPQNVDSRATLLNLTVDLVNKHLTASMGFPEPMEPAKSLARYGLDSLATVELRNWLYSKLEVDLSATDISNAKSLFALCEKIVERMHKS